MYRRRSSGTFGILLTIIVGLIGGVVFMLGRTPPAALTPTEPAPTAVPAVTEVAAVPTSAPRRYQMLIPDAAISASIIHLPFGSDGSWDVSMLGANVGHLQRTPWFDQPGNVVIVGHVEMFNGGSGPFAALPQLDPGATIYIVDESNVVVRTYRVEETRTTSPDDISVLNNSSGERLTLITCSGYDFISNAYLERVVTVANRVV